MAKTRKPIPKSQKEISENINTSYTGNDPNDRGLGNNSNEQVTGIEFNRASKISFNGDNVKPFTVSIEDIDNTIMFYFQNVIKPFVIQNNERIEVPIIYGSPERWKSMQKDGYYRDKLGKVMAPLISFKRNEIIKNRSITNKLDANNPNLYVNFKKQYSNKNFYSNFNVLTNRVPEQEYYANVVPDYVTVTYDCIIITYYTDQMNKIVEAINYASDSYWGDPNRFKFKTSIDSFNDVTELITGEDRIVKSTFKITLNGYIIPDVIQKDVSALKKLPSLSKITFTLETTGTTENIGTKVTTKQNNIIATFFDNVTLVNNNVSQNVLDYLSLNNIKIANTSSITNNGTTSTVTFLSASIATAPITLPTTSVANFSIYINGQYLEQSAITSFSPSGSNVVLTVNNASLGFGLNNTMEIIAAGKFL